MMVLETNPVPKVFPALSFFRAVVVPRHLTHASGHRD